MLTMTELIQSVHKYYIKLLIKHKPVKSHCILVVIHMYQLNHVMKIKSKIPILWTIVGVRGQGVNGC